MFARLFFTIFFAFLLVKHSTSQVADTATVPLQNNSTEKPHFPKKAALMSAILPGLGQAYNKKYWKMPLIYAGFTGLGYAFAYNQTRYAKYRDAYKYRIDGDATTVDQYVGYYSDKNLFDLQQFYHRYRDLSLIGAGLLYVLNIIDASVDAHLFTFDVSDDLTLNIKPTFNHTSANYFRPELSIKLNF